MNELSVGDRLGRYELVEQVGRGGIGVVYRARRDDGETVAVKVMRSHLSTDTLYVRRFAHEARAARAVSHPQLVPLLEAGQAGGHPYIVMPYVPGGTLMDHVSARGTLDLAEVVTVIGQVASALDALHRAGLVHRDVKPANILISAEQGALLTDFGLARGRADTVLTRVGSLVGTLHYVAPELLLGQPASASSDTYALGCVAYTCLAGAPPFADYPQGRVGQAHLDVTPDLPAAWRSDVPVEVGQVVLRALAKDPADRPRTPVNLARMLSSAVAAAAPGGSAPGV